MNIPRSNWLRKSQFLGKDKWYSNLISANARIRRDHGTSSIIHTFAHHVHSKQTFLFLQHLKAMQEIITAFNASLFQILQDWHYYINNNKNNYEHQYIKHTNLTWKLHTKTGWEGRGKDRTYHEDTAYNSMQLLLLPKKKNSAHTPTLLLLS